jgi:DNA-binding FadR family transcriptional regulator
MRVARLAAEPEGTFMTTDLVRLPKMAELIAADIRRQVVHGALKEGDALPSEPDLMEKYGVSRPTLREAMRLLEAESLITVKRGPRGGAQIRMPDIGVAARYAGLLLQHQGASLDDIYEARTIIEPACCRMLAAQDNAEAIETLSKIIAEEEALLNDPEAFNVAASHLHASITTLAGNQTLAAFAGMIYSIIEAQHSAAAVLTVGDPEDGLKRRRRALKAHRVMLSLVSDGLADEAEIFWRNHMKAVQAELNKGDRPRTLLELFDRR